MKWLWVSALIAAIIGYCRPVSAQFYTRSQALRVAEAMRSEGVLSNAGLDLLKRRIHATSDSASNGSTQTDAALWWVRNHGKSADTVYDLSRASVLNFLLYCFAGETWYRFGEGQDRDAAKALGIYGRMPPNPKTDSAGFVRQLQLLDSIDRIPHPGKAIEAAIGREDPWPHGWHTFVIEEVSTGILKRLGHGYIDPALSVSGKTRSKLVRKLEAAGLIDRYDALFLKREIHRGKILQESQIVAVGLRRAIATLRKG